MPFNAREWLDRDVVDCLKKKCGTLDNAVGIAYQASGGAFGRLHAWGVRDLSGNATGSPEMVLPEGCEQAVWAFVAAYHGCETQSKLDQTTSTSSKPGGPGEIPIGLVEQAVQRHVAVGAGRRVLSRLTPGLSEWTAGQILRWYGVGKPAGLWLDEESGRLRWGSAITPIGTREQRESAVSPTPVALRLPRI